MIDDLEGWILEFGKEGRMLGGGVNAEGNQALSHRETERERKTQMEAD
jgi:hypothetical protein